MTDLNGNISALATRIGQEVKLKEPALPAGGLSTHYLRGDKTWQFLNWSAIASKPSTFAPIIGSGAADAVAGNDARLTDARTPTAHTHTAANISDASAIGKTVLTAADGPAIRSAIGAGTSSLAIGTTSTTAKAGDYQPAAANISDSGATGRALVQAATAAAARTAAGAEPTIATGTTSQFWRGDKTWVDASHLVNDFWTTAKPSVINVTDVLISFDQSSIEGSSCTLSGTNITLTKIGVWRVEMNMKYDFYATGTQPRIGYINVGANRVISQEAGSPEGHIGGVGRNVRITTSTVVQLGAWQNTGSTRLLAAGRWGATSLTCTWLGP